MCMYLLLPMCATAMHGVNLQASRWRGKPCSVFLASNIQNASGVFSFVSDLNLSEPIVTNCRRNHTSGSGLYLPPYLICPA